MNSIRFGILAFLLSYILPLSSSAQNFEIVAKVPTKEVSTISVDKKNMLYVADIQGDVRRYTAQGELIQFFSPQRKGIISIVEAWASLRILVFYEDYQEYLLLDRFLNQTSAYSFSPEHIGFAKTTTLAADNRLWVFDNTDFSLKKYDPIAKTNLLITSLDLLLDPVSHDINFMREYQNLLFINNKNKGILLFDNLGNYKKTLEYPGLDYIGVRKDEIYFLHRGRLYFYNVYKDQESYLNLPLDAPWNFAGTLGEYYFTISDSMIYFFKEIE